VLGQLHVPQVTALLAALFLAACTPLGSAQHHASPSPARAAASPSPSPLPDCLHASAVPAPPAGVRTSVPAWVLAAGFDQPDDLAFHEGAVLVGQLGSGKVATVTPGLPVAQSSWSVPVAEGIAFLGQDMYVASQGQDRILKIVAGQPQDFLQLKPVTGKDNVDGIGVQGDQLLIPDSPNGTLLWVDAGGRITRTVGGFNRPTGAWPLPDGSVLVADEYGNAAFKVAPDGSRTALVQGLPIVDDVAADPDGRIFVITPVVSGGRLAELVGGRAVDLAGGMLEPQGLGFDGAGNALVTETAAGRLDLFIRSFKLVPVAQAPAAGQPVCLDLVRAPGFTGPVQLSGPNGVEVIRQPGTGDQGEVLLHPELCQQRGCPVTASSGGRTDTLWITR
jgi:hypothetical protein